MRTIIFANQKGGVLKTTTTFTVADALAKKGYRVLMIDTDSQCNLSTAFNVDAASCKYNCENILDEEPVSIKDIVVKTRAGDLVPGSSGFQKADDYNSDPTNFTALKTALAEVKDDYDFCLIDVPPLLTFLFYMDIYAADYVVSPVDVSEFSFNSFIELTKKILMIKKKLNPEVRVAGLLLTKVNARTKDFVEAKKTYEKMATMLETKVFDNFIPNSIKMGESVKQKMSVFDLYPESSVAKAYGAFTEELLKSIGA